MAIDVTRGATAGAAQYPILKLNEAKDVIAISKSAAFTLELTGGDYKTVIIMSGTATKTVTFSKGNGIQGAGDVNRGEQGLPRAPVHGKQEGMRGNSATSA